MLAMTATTGGYGVPRGGAQNLTNAMQFERLSVPKRLEQIENELRANRIGDPERLIPVLEKVESNQQIVNYARTQAGRIKKQIQTAKKP